MPYLVIRQKFTDYDRWRRAFDSLTDRRLELGLEAVAVTRNMEDPDEAVVIFRFEDIELVREHFPSPELEAAHREGGVVDGSTQPLFLRDADSF